MGLVGIDIICRVNFIDWFLNVSGRVRVDV